MLRNRTSGQPSVPQWASGMIGKLDALPGMMTELNELKKQVAGIRDSQASLAREVKTLVGVITDMANEQKVQQATRASSLLHAASTEPARREDIEFEPNVAVGLTEDVAPGVPIVRRVMELLKDIFTEIANARSNEAMVRLLGARLMELALAIKEVIHSAGDSAALQERMHQFYRRLLLGQKLVHAFASVGFLYHMFHESGCGSSAGHEFTQLDFELSKMVQELQLVTGCPIQPFSTKNYAEAGGASAEAAKKIELMGGMQSVFFIPYKQRQLATMLDVSLDDLKNEMAYYFEKTLEEADREQLDMDEGPHTLVLHPTLRCMWRAKFGGKELVTHDAFIEALRTFLLASLHLPQEDVGALMGGSHTPRLLSSVDPRATGRVSVLDLRMTFSADGSLVQQIAERSAGLFCSVPPPLPHRVGLQSQLDEALEHALPTTPTRVLALSGAEGCGKSQFTRAVCARLVTARAHTGGLYLCDLHGLPDLGEAITAVAHATGARVRTDAQDDLVEWVGRLERETLIVVDGDAVVDGLWQYLEELLEHSRWLTIVLASRGVYNEALPETAAAAAAAAPGGAEPHAPHLCHHIQLTPPSTAESMELVSRLAPTLGEVGVNLAHAVGDDPGLLSLMCRLPAPAVARALAAGDQLDGGAKLSAVRAEALQAAYDALLPQLRELCLVLAHFPAYFDARAVAACCGRRLEEREVALMLEELEDLHVVQSCGGGRIRVVHAFRDLLLEHVAAQAAPERDAVQLRFVQYYTDLIVRAAAMFCRSNVLAALWLLDTERVNVDALFDLDVTDKLLPAVMPLATDQAVKFLVARMPVDVLLNFCNKCLAVTADPRLEGELLCAVANVQAKGGGGDYEAGAQAAQQALDLFVPALGADHIDVARAKFHLGWSLFRQSDFDAARPCFEDAVRIRRRELGESHLETAAALSALALILRRANLFAEAEEAQLHSIDIIKVALGDQHPDLAAGYNSLAVLYKAMSRLNEAEEHYELAISIQKSVLGESSQEVGKTCNNIANLYKALGRLNDAEAAFMESLRIKIQRYGETHASVADTYFNLGLLYQQMHRLRDACDAMAKSARISAATNGPEHKYTQDSLSVLADLQQMA